MRIQAFFQHGVGESRYCSLYTDRPGLMLCRAVHDLEVQTKAKEDPRSFSLAVCERVLAWHSSSPNTTRTSKSNEAICECLVPVDPLKPMTQRKLQ